MHPSDQHRPLSQYAEGSNSPARLLDAGDVSHSFEMLRSAFDSTIDAILIAAADGRICGFNRNFVEIWGIPEHVLAQRSDHAAIDHVRDQLVDPDAFVGRIAELYSNPTSEGMDVLHMKDGRTIERYSVPQRANGVTIGRVWTFRDVTERTRIHAALRASEARFRAVFDHAAVGIALIEPDGRIAESNRALRQFLGYTVAQLRDRRFYDLVPVDDAAQLAAGITALSAGDVPDVTMEQRYTRARWQHCVGRHNDVACGRWRGRLSRHHRDGPGHRHA